MQPGAREYYVVVNQVGFGPFSLGSLKQLRAAGVIAGHSSIWQPKMLEPIALSDLLKSPRQRYPARPTPVVQRVMAIAALSILCALVALVVFLTPARVQQWATRQSDAENFGGRPAISQSAGGDLANSHGRRAGNEPPNDLGASPGPVSTAFNYRYESRWTLGSDELLSLAVTRDSRLVAVGSAAAELILWDYVGQQRKWSTTVDGKRVYGIGFSADQQSVYAADGSSLLVYQVNNGLLSDRNSVIRHDKAWFSQSGEYVVLYENQNGSPNLAIYQLSPFRKLSQGSRFAAATVFASGHAFFGAKDLYRQELFPVVPADRIFVGAEFELGALAVSPAGNQLALGFERGNGSNIDPVIYLFDLASQNRIGLPPAHTEYIHALAFSKDGRWLASGGGGTVTDRYATRRYGDCNIRIWDVSRRQLAGQFSGLESSARQLSWRDDDRTVLGIVYGSPMLFSWRIPPTRSM